MLINRPPDDSPLSIRPSARAFAALIIILNKAVNFQRRYILAIQKSEGVLGGIPSLSDDSDHVDSISPPPFMEIDPTSLRSTLYTICKELDVVEEVEQRCGINF